MTTSRDWTYRAIACPALPAGPSHLAEQPEAVVLVSAGALRFAVGRVLVAAGRGEVAGAAADSYIPQTRCSDVSLRVGRVPNSFRGTNWSAGVERPAHARA